MKSLGEISLWNRFGENSWLNLLVKSVGEPGLLNRFVKSVCEISRWNRMVKSVGEIGWWTRQWNRLVKPDGRSADQKKVAILRKWFQNWSEGKKDTARGSGFNFLECLLSGTEKRGGKNNGRNYTQKPTKNSLERLRASSGRERRMRLTAGRCNLIALLAITRVLAYKHNFHANSKNKK